MKVSGSAVLRAPIDQVYAALNDPAVLVATIPGCKELEQVGPDAYRVTVSAGVASIKGTYVGDVRLTDQQAPTSFVLRASGAGAPGTVSADVTVTLADGTDGTTQLSYAAEAVVGGAVGGVGQRVLSGVARKTAGEFFAAVDRHLTGAGAATTDATVGGTTGGIAVGGTTEAAAAGGVAGPVRFTAPAPPAGGVMGGSFVQGALFGAGVALLGAVVGGLLARRRQL